MSGHVLCLHLGRTAAHGIFSNRTDIKSTKFSLSWPVIKQMGNPEQGEQNLNVTRTVIGKEENV